MKKRKGKPKKNSPTVIISPQPNAPGQEMKYLDGISIAKTYAYQHNNVDATAYILQQLAKYDPENIELLTLLAFVALSRYQFQAAQKITAKALAISPNNLDALTHSAQADTLLGDNLSAEKKLKRAIKLQPNTANIHRLLGLLYGNMGKREEALRSFSMAIDLPHCPIDTFYNKAHALNEALPDSDILKLEKTLQQNKSEDSKAYYHFTKASHYRFQEKHDSEFSHLNKGSIIIKNRYPWNEQQEKNQNDAICGKISTNILNHIAPSQSSLKTPFFIAGMPRSGTSLVERIISSHSKVTATGETGFFPQSINEFQHANNKEITQWINDDPDSFSSQSSKLDQLISSKFLDLHLTSPYITDKSFSNEKYLGIYFSMYPASRAIYCRRHPLDITLSSYQILFAFGQWPSSYDLQSLAKSILYHQQLMEHWQSLFPERILLVDYEELVSNQEEKTREMVKFLGLDWEPECLNFHKSSAAVATSSKWQVNKPLYTDSVNRWKRYGKHLKPAADILGIDIEQ